MPCVEPKRVKLLAWCLLVFTVLPFPFSGVSKLKAQSSEVPPNHDPFQRGLTALKESRFEAALEDLNRAEREHPDDPRVRNFRGIALSSVGRNAEAGAEFQEAIRLSPAMQDAYRNLGFLEWKQHQLEAAAKHLARAVELSPDDSFAHYYLGRVHLDSSHFREAFNELDQAHVPWPEDSAFLIEAAAGYVAVGREGDARKTIIHATTLPLNSVQCVQAAALLLTVHEADTAISLLQKLRLANPQGWARFDLAKAYLLAGKYGDAAREAHAYLDSAKSSEPQPNLVAAWSLIGIANAHLGQPDQSVDAFRRGTQLAPAQEETWLNLTRELMELARYQDAIIAIQRALASNAKSYALHLRLGAAFLAADRYAEAEKVFRELVTAGDPLPMSYVGLAQVLLRTGRADDAASELALARQKLGPTFLISYFQGLALQRAGKASQAASAFQEAVRLNPNSADAHLGLGKTELAQGHIPSAVAELQQVLRLDPANVQAQRLLSQAYRRAGDVNRATQSAEASTKTLSTHEGELVGDFFLPDWQMPPGSPKE